jgi:hypothetical protein
VLRQSRIDGQSSFFILHMVRQNLHMVRQNLHAAQQRESIASHFGRSKFQLGT